MHQADAAVQIRLLIPCLEARAHGNQRRLLFCLADVKQIGHHLPGQVHPVVHHHPLQVQDSERCGLTQALQGKARTWPQGLTVLTDQRRIAAQRRLRVGHPG